MAVQPFPQQEDLTPGIPPGVLRRWDWILALLFLVLFWGLGLGMGLRGLAVAGGLILCAVAFLFPRTGLLLALGGELVLSTLTMFTSVNRIPTMKSGEGTIGYEIPFEFHVMLGCIVLLAMSWTGTGFSLILSGDRWYLGRLERALVSFLALAAIWCLFSIGHGANPLPMLYDLHVIFFWGSAVLFGRLVSDRRGWLQLIGLSAAGAVVHGLALLVDLTGPGIFNSPEYLTDVIRNAVGGSPDLAGTFVPVLLALDLLVLKRTSRLRALTGTAMLLLTFRTLATLSRSAIAQLILSLILLYAAMSLGAERRRLASRLWWLLGILALVLGLGMVAVPRLRTAALYVVTERVLDVTAGRERAAASEEYVTGRFANADGSSDLYRELETETALEQMAGDWLVGRGPGAVINKRFRGHEPASQEAYLHNGYLWYVLKFGLVGLVLLLWTYATFFRVGLRGLRQESLAPWERALTMGYLASVAPLLITAWTNNIIGAPTGLYFLVPGFAWMCALERQAPVRAEENVAPSGA